MLFHSYVFILLFLPFVVIGYFGMNRFWGDRAGKCFLLVMSLIFYSYHHISYLVLILFSVLFNFGISKGIDRTGRKSSRKLLLLGALTVNLGLLGYFKYMDFFLSNLNFIFSADFPLLRIALPLGISFFTFQQISFIVDTYHGQVPGYSFLDYANYVTFFPQLVAGPIVTHDQLVTQFGDPDRKKVDYDSLARGISRFSTGLVKKLILADSFGKAADWGYGNLAALDSTNAFLVTLAYTFQIYFDFSGYCDMAVGIGKMLCIDLPENFLSPYKARSITEFWERWHITLTRFFTRYVYIPLGGNRKGKIRTSIHIMIVFLASGLWHGADWSFVLWGALHGLFLVINRNFKKFFDQIPAFLGWIITFGFVNAAWIFFRAESVKSAVSVFGIILKGQFGPISETLKECFSLPEVRFFLIRLMPEQLYLSIMTALYFAGAFALMLCCKNAHEKMERFRADLRTLLCAAIFLVWGIFSLSGISQFLYFNF